MARPEIYFSRKGRKALISSLATQRAAKFPSFPDASFSQNREMEFVDQRCKLLTIKWFYDGWQFLHFPIVARLPENRESAQDGKSIIPMMKKGEEPYFQRA